MAVSVGTAYQAEGANVTLITAASVVLAANDVADVTVALRNGDDETVTSVPFNGSATGVTNITTSSGAGERVLLAKYRIVGVTGTADVVANFNESVTAALIFVQVLQGVDNATPVGTTDTDTDLGTESGTLTSTVTLSSGDLSITAIVTGVAFAAATMSISGGQTQIFAPNDFGVADATAAVSYETGTGAVAGGYTWNGTLAGWARQIAVPYLAAAGGAATIARRLLTLGVGN